MRIRLPFLLILALVLSATPARGAEAPIDHPGPALDVAPATLAAALSCTPGIAGDARAPVLLVPGSGATPQDNYGWNYEPALNARHIPWCAISLPDSANNDIQVAGEYLVYAIRTLHARAARRIEIIGTSQGGMVPRWALRFWPDTRPMVDDLIGLAPSNHGSYLPNVSCRNGCSPADWQQTAGSRFLTALNSPQETVAGVNYTVVESRTDEENVPDGPELHTGPGRVVNVHTQDICPNNTVDHLGIGTYDNVAWSLVIDALEHPGAPADPARIPLSVCAQPLMPGVNPATFPTDAAHAAYDVETSESPTLYAEPPLACYVTLSCAVAAGGRGGARCQPLSRWRFRLRAARRHRRVRIVDARFSVGRRLVASLRGRRLRNVTLPALVRGPVTVRVRTRASDGTRRTARVHFGACAPARRA